MLNWDRSHDWVVQRFWNDRTLVAIRFRQLPPTALELAALRRCLPQFRNTAPAIVRAAISAAGELPLGQMPTPEAREVIRAAEHEGLEVFAECASFVSYLPYDRTTGCAWLIEDDSEAAVIAQAMIASGVPVQQIEA